MFNLLHSGRSRAGVTTRGFLNPNKIQSVFEYIETARLEIVEETRCHMAHGHKATKCRNRAATNISGSLRTNPISEAEYPTLFSVAAILITNIQTEYLSNPT